MTISPTLLLTIACSLLGAPQAFSQPFFADSSLTSLPQSAMPENGMDVESADIDFDGDFDIIIANEYQANVILVNNGRGRFTNESAARLPQPQYDSEDIAVGDFNNDGAVDIIFVSEDTRVHEYYLNDGSGVFSIAPYRLPESEANAVTTADIDGDGRLDLVIGNAGQDFILINDRNGGFRNETAARLPLDESVTQDVELVDIDNDSDLDLIQGNEDGNRLFLNTGEGIFVDETESRLPILTNMETRKVAAADLDKDGFLDLFFANVAFRQGKDLQDRLYMNDGTGHFVDVTDGFLPSGSDHTIDGRFADIDHDSDMDLITSSFMNRPVRVMFNDGKGRFTDRTADVFPAPISGDGLGLELVDLNGDGFIDLYICNRGQRDRVLLHTKRRGDVTNGLRGSAAPNGLRNLQTGPNPASSEVVIEYDLEKRAFVQMRLYDTRGESVTTIVSALCLPGAHRYIWDPAGSASGVYMLHIEIDGESLSRQIVVP